MIFCTYVQNICDCEKPSNQSVICSAFKYCYPQFLFCFKKAQIFLRSSLWLNFINNIMEGLTTDEKVQLSLTLRESVHMSYYFILFSKLPYEVKRSVMYANRMWTQCNYSDTESNSNDSVLIPRMPNYYKITRATAQCWNSISIQHKATWNIRAAPMMEDFKKLWINT